MGIFKSAETKERERQMYAEREKNMLEAKYGLELLNDKDLEIVKEIAKNQKFTTKQNTPSSILTFKLEDRAKINNLDILTQQNWLIIRQLAEISKKLDNK